MKTITPGTLEVSSSDRAIIQWDEFSLADGESARFTLPDSKSAVLNRIASQQPSEIFGEMQSNGQVILVNQNGVFFGKSARIDVGSLIASSSDVLTLPFQSSGDIHFSGAPKGNIFHEGLLQTRSGEALLFGNQVSMEGEIISRIAEKGGEISLLGDDIFIGPQAHLNAVGIGGGTIAIGIDDSRGMKADRVFVSAGSLLTASSVNNGAGGKVCVFGTSSLICRGEILAEGGSESGNGGFVDLSTHSFFDFTGTVSTAAPNGNTGTLLFDPIDLTISTAPGDVSVTAGPNFAPTAVGANLTPASIVAALLGNNVIISTVGTVGPQTGAITVNDPISWSTSNSLSFLAAGDIVVNRSVENLNPGAAALSAQSNSGSIYIGNAAMTSPARFGSDRGPVTVIACQGDVVIRGSDAANVCFAVIGNYNTPAPPILSTGNLTVQAGRNLIMRSGTGLTVGPGLQQRCFAAITRMGPQVNVNVDSDIFVTVGQDLIMDTSGVDESETSVLDKK
jgi:filamentous hemagglutinin family protein